MDFFGDYSIETASCHPSSLGSDEDTMYAQASFPLPSPLSPRDTRTPYSDTMVNMSNLARQFNLQSLDRPSMNISQSIESSILPTSPSQARIPSSPLRRPSISSPRGAPCWKRRMHRHSATRLLSDEHHLKSISELVGRMVDSNDQCGISKGRDADLTPTPPTPCVNDGIRDDPDSSDNGSPRSLSSSSSLERRPSYFEAEYSPTHRRPVEAGTLSMTLRDSRVQKSRARKGARR